MKTFVSVLVRDAEILGHVVRRHYPDTPYIVSNKNIPAWLAIIELFFNERLATRAQAVFFVGLDVGIIHSFACGHYILSAVLFTARLVLLH